MTIEGVTGLPGHTLDAFITIAGTADGPRSRPPKGQQPIRLAPTATSSYQRVSAPSP